MNGWGYLAFAVVFEVAGASCLKLSNGLTKLWPTFWMFFFYVLTFIGLAVAIKQIKVSVAYAVWAGIGIVLITFVDLFLFKTQLSALKLFAIALVVIGAVMLKLLSN